MLLERKDKIKADTDRVESMKKIRGVLKDVSSIFNKMGTMVKMHEGMIERIDQDADHSERNVDKAKGEVRKIFEDQASNRKLILQVFGIIIVFCIIYTMLAA